MIVIGIGEEEHFLLASPTSNTFLFISLFYQVTIMNIVIGIGAEEHFLLASPTSNSISLLGFFGYSKSPYTKLYSKTIFVHSIHQIFILLVNFGQVDAGSI